MTSVATLSRRSVHPSALASAPSAPAYPCYSTSPLGDCCPGKPAAAASYPPMTYAEVSPAAAPPASAPMPCPPCPPSPFEAAPSSHHSMASMPSSCAPPTPSAGSYAAAQPSAAASYAGTYPGTYPSQPSVAVRRAPPAPAAQFTYQQHDDKVQPRGCFNCSPETGAAIGTVIGGALAVAGIVALQMLHFAIIFL